MTSLRRREIPITRPILGDEEIAAVAERLRSGWLVQGPKVAEFERGWAAYTGAPHARATTSCTTALHLALLAVGVGPGDEVVVPSFTWVATANSVEMCGATPVFADVDAATFCLDPDAAAAAITARTKVIMPVHQFGLAADLDRLLPLAHRHGLALVEDAACAAGSLYRDRHVGTFGAAGCFSFHPRKAITTGEGGMVVTADPGIARTVEVLRGHGAEASDLERHASGAFALPEFRRLGFNYRMTDLQAAIGVVQLGRLPGILAERRSVAARYDRLLAGVPGLTLPVEPPGRRHVYQSYVVMLDSPVERDRLALQLGAAGITSRPGTHAVHALEYYSSKYRLGSDDLPVAWRADRQSLTLPVYPGMAEDDQDYVVQQIRAALG